MWELGAASPSGDERADLVSPTVLPQLSQSERQVREPLTLPSSKHCEQAPARQAQSHRLRYCH